MQYQGLSQQLVQQQQLLFVTRVSAQGHKRPQAYPPNTMHPAMNYSNVIRAVDDIRW